MTDDIGGCSGVNMNSSTTTEHVYNIFRLEEDSSYSFHVRAYNSAGSSVVSDPVSTVTLEAGKSHKLGKNCLTYINPQLRLPLPLL